MSKDRKEQLIGILLIATAAIIWGWNGPMTKSINSSIDVLTVIFFRTIIAVVVATPIFFIFDDTIFDITFRKFLFLFFYGTFIVSGTTIGFFYALQYLSVSSALLIHYSFPILTMVGAVFIVKESPSLLQLFSAFLVLLGVGLGVLFSPDQVSRISIPGVLWGLLAAVGISLQTLYGRFVYIKNFISQATLLYHGFLWSLVSIAFCKTITTGWSDIPLITSSEWVIIVTLGLIGSLLAHFLYLKGLRRITAPLGSLVSSLELVAAIIFGAILLKEFPSMVEIIGSFIVMLAITLASVSPGKMQRQIEKVKSYFI